MEDKEMKKTYQNPTTKTVKIHTVQMIAASEQLGFGAPVSTAAGTDSRQGGDFWDDEDE